MNPDASSLSDSHLPPPVPIVPSAVEWTRDGEFSDPFNWRQWLRRLLVCNPFFLASAALLLFGLNRLSVDPGFLGREESKLFFNFTALQGYEILVVATAVVLARRRIWYDSALLVVLENGLLIVPFLFITQAALIDRRLAGALSVAAGVLALARLAAVRRWYPRFNLPAGLLGLGAVVMAANLALVFVSRHVMETTFENWAEPNERVWTWFLPALFAGVNLLPKPTRRDGLEPERPWLPLLIAGFWMAGTAAHVWCVAWICKLPLEAWHLAPGLWVAAWTLFHRLGDCQAEPSRTMRKGLLALTLIAPLLAFGHGATAAVLMGLNGAGYLLLDARVPELRASARFLATLAWAGVIGCTSREWLQTTTGWLPAAGELPAIGAGLFVIMTALRLPHPVVGLAAALVGMVGVAHLATPQSFHAALQAGAVLLVLHSLRWDDALHAGARVLRVIALALWLLDAAAWTRSPEWDPVLVANVGALVVLAGWAVVRSRGHTPDRLVPGAAWAVILAGPCNWLQRSGSPGLLALLGSLLLFAGGVAWAWRRPRTESEDTAAESKPTNIRSC
jgi:hypothetical protein